MKRLTVTLAPALLLASTLTFADDLDCFPMCQAPDPAPIRLCEHAAVREVARIDRELAPVKKLYDIAKNPTGFAIHEVGERAGVHVPEWVGLALDPRGYVRGLVLDRARLELKKAVGLENDCRDEIAAERA